MSFKTFIGWSILLMHCYLSLQEDSFETCNRYTSFGYGYRDFFEFRNGNFSPNQIFYLDFYVKTSSDAHILLKSDLSVDEGYEIVIGGGSNTFSQIRLLEPEVKKTMITQKTENYLSGENYKNFWISIDELGIISVGKKENDEVFINWRFDNPFRIKYFSFGSWTNMKADWRFGCKEHKDVVHEETVFSPLRKLKRDLFTLYDPNALPVEKRSTLEVKVNFQINNVQLNEKRGELTMYGLGDLVSNDIGFETFAAVLKSVLRLVEFWLFTVVGVSKWMDNKIRWKPENYNGIETIYVPPFLIWTPNIRVFNALAIDKAPLFDLTAAGVVAKYDGSVFWRPPFKSISHCEVDLKYWPYDIHNCSVYFGFWMEPSNLVLSMMDEYDTISKEKTESGWKIMKVIPFNTNHPDEDENYGMLYVQLKRAGRTQTLIITAPFIASLLMTLTSFWLPLGSSLKLHLMSGSLVILLLTLFSIDQSVPAMTKTVPRIINLYSWSVVISCVPIILYVILKNIEFSKQIPEVLSKLLNNKTFSRIFCLPDLNEIAVEYSNLNDEMNKTNKDRLNALRLLTVMERLFFYAYLVAIILLYLLI